MLDDSKPFSSPRAFGPYRVMHQIGVGVLGPVFRASASDGTRAIALKAFHLDLPPEPSSTFASALQETIHAGTVHSVLVSPFDAGLSDLVPYLASEYVAAESLDTIVRQDASVSVETALPFVIQLAEGFDAAHAAGLVHGALHLRDLFVTPTLPRVTGFGLVTALERVGLQAPLRRPYTAPEQIAGAGWGAAADRFALAAVVYEMLTGRRAVGTTEQRLERLAGVPGVRDVVRVVKLFAAALAERPAARPGSAGMFAGELAEAVGWSWAHAQRDTLAGVGGAGTTDRHDGVLAGDPSEPWTALAVRDAADAGSEITGSGTEGADMAIRRTPESEPEPEFDWSERSLDRAEPHALPPADDDIAIAADHVVVAEDDPAFAGDDVEHEAGAVAFEDAAVAAGDAENLEDRETGRDAGWSASRDAGGYGTIVLTDLDDLPADADAGEDTAAVEEEEETTPEIHRYLSPASGSVGDADAEPDAAEHAGAEYAGAEYDDEPEDVLIGGAVEGWTSSARRSLVTPFVAIALVVVLAAFAIGFGLVGGGGSQETDAPSETTLAGGGVDVPTDPPPAAQTALAPATEAALEPAAEAALGPAAEAALGQEFSEVTVTDGPAGAAAESPANRAPADAPPVSARTPPVPAPRPVVADGRLLVRTTPPGAQVIVNGAVRGTTPLVLSQLSYDNYDVVLTLDGHESQERRLAISANDPIAAVQADLIRIAGPGNASLEVGSIFADTRPRGVQVWLDKRLVGETPMLIPDVAAGPHEVEFKQDGYREWATTVRVDSSAQARVTASLDRAR